MAREEKKIIFSAQPYEDAKSAISFVVFLIIGPIVLVGVAIYYFVAGVIAVAKWSLYYLTWLWWFPLVEANKLMNVAEKQKGFWLSSIPMISAVVVISVVLICTKRFQITTILIYSVLSLWLVFLFYYLYCLMFIV